MGLLKTVDVPAVVKGRGCDIVLCSQVSDGCHPRQRVLRLVEACAERGLNQWLQLGPRGLLLVAVCFGV